MPQKVITHGSVVCLPSLTEQPWAPQSVQHSLNPLYAILPHDKGPGVTLEEELDDQGGGAPSKLPGDAIIPAGHRPSSVITLRPSPLCFWEPLKHCTINLIIPLAPLGELVGISPLFVS